MENGRSEVESLKDEMDEWRGNMEGTPLEQTSKYESVSEAADTLENAYSSLEDAVNGITELEIPLEKQTEISYVKPYGRYESRSTRMAYALACLNKAIEELKELEPKPEELEGYLDDLENAVSDLESVEFPGMY